MKKVVDFLISKNVLQISIIVITTFLLFVFTGFHVQEGKWVCINGKWEKIGRVMGSPDKEVCEEFYKKNISQNNLGMNLSTSTSLLSSTSSLSNTTPLEISYCALHNGKIEYRKRGDEAEYVVCVFPKGRECEVENYLQEQCPPNGALITGQKTIPARYCLVMGGEYRPLRDKNYKTEKERGTCVFLNNKKCDVNDLWNGKCQREVFSASTTKLITLTTSTVDNTLRDSIVNFDGVIIPDDSLVKTYGEFPEIIFKKQPSIVLSIKKLIPTFEINQMGQGFKTVVAMLPNKQKYIIFSGCSFDGCAGTLRVGAYYPLKKQLFFLSENDARSEVSIYGNPDNSVRLLLLYIYFSLW